MEDRERIARDASYWVSLIEEGGPLEQLELVTWLCRHPMHVAEYLTMLELEWALHFPEPFRPGPTHRCGS
jgi:hypothetical protein